METLAFYSYKGGVGRSLLLASAARFLAGLGQKVVAVDLDLEAPGLHYKLGQARRLDGPSAPAAGVVPYLLAMVRRAASLPPLQDHLLDVAVSPDAGGWLRLMPAGPAPRRAYWTTLKKLGDRLRLDDPSGEGLMALLDLHARIQEELDPDYLLIDARSGVTEMGGLATAILADTVVCLFVANQESIDGTLTVAEALKSAQRLPGQQAVRVVPVLARVAGENDGHRLGEGMKRLAELGETPGIDGMNGPCSLPHDESQNAEDGAVAGDWRASAAPSLRRGHRELFRILFPSVKDGADRCSSGAVQAKNGQD